MMGWKSMGPWVVSQIFQPERPRLPDDHTEDTLSYRKRSDLGLRCLVDAHGDELTQPLAIFVQYSHGRILGLKDLAGDLCNLLKDRFQ